MFKSFLSLNKELWRNRRVVFAMGRTEFRNEYVGSALGIVWGLLKPFIMVAAYWFVFSIGMRAGMILNVPYVAWLIPGLFSWTFLSDSLVGGTGAIRNNSHLVKKIVFPVSILPIVKLYSNFLNHVIFMTIAVILIIFLKVQLTIYAIQIIYYCFSGIIFTVALTRLLSAMAVISIDVMHFISTIMQLLFWATPVVWNPEVVGGKSLLLLNIMKLNPYFYLVQGYRISLFEKQWAWEQPYYMLYFWLLTIFLFFIGSYYYSKTRKEFADVI
ncbi:MAG: ABC transporter permease [Culicoidibacterales bacterium]